MKPGDETKSDLRSSNIDIPGGGKPPKTSSRQDEQKTCCMKPIVKCLNRTIINFKFQKMMVEKPPIAINANHKKKLHYKMERIYHFHSTATYLITLSNFHATVIKQKTWLSILFRHNQINFHKAFEKTNNTWEYNNTEHCAFNHSLIG